jgi:glycerol-3-phosphate dehydrogenase (NAD(P)+)
VTVVGAGSWGTTVASIAARNTPTLLWARDPDIAQSVNASRENPRYLPGLGLSPALRATSDLAEATAAADVLVMAVPAQSMRGVLERLTPQVRPWIPIVSLSKGLELGTAKRMTTVIEEVLPGHPVGVLAGPNLAREVVLGYAAAATIAMSHYSSAELLQPLFSSPRFRVYTSEDVVGAEIAGAAKNVYAIAVGFGDGLGAGDNTRAMIITRSLHEITRLGVAMGARQPTLAGLTGLGDLIATCTSPLSRNRFVGLELGKGRSLEDIVAGMNQVAEGIKTASAVMRLAEDHGIEMPIAAEVDGVINRGKPVADTYRGLLQQLPGHEIHGEAW